MEPIEKTEAGNEQNQQNDGGKIAKQYDTNIKKLVAIVSGKENLYPQKKVTEDAMGEIVTELLKEQKEALAKTVKEDLKSILDKKVQLDKDLKAKEDELAKLKQTKQKEFNEACAKIFAKVENIEALEKNYYATLGRTSDELKDLGNETEAK
jgi:hypothetical protein